MDRIASADTRKAILAVCAKETRGKAEVYGFRAAAMAKTLGLPRGSVYYACRLMYVAGELSLEPWHGFIFYRDLRRAVTKETS